MVATRDRVTILAGMNRFTDSERRNAETLIALAFAEDLGEVGDRTSLATIPADRQGQAVFVARKPGVLAGIPVLHAIQQSHGSNLTWEYACEDSTVLQPGMPIATMRGSMRTILAVERTALNFLQRLCGIATLTRQYVNAIAGLPAVVLDTRKTTPGWRLLEKYAVRMGGGTNHRIGLYDGILIKDNHLAALQPREQAVALAIAAAREHAPDLFVEIEVDSLEQLAQALPCHPEIVLLDNMSNAQLREAVALRNTHSPTTRLEASGGVNLTTIRGIAETGVDRISVGALTHSATALDIGLDYADA
ncbi:carboxylating nicotinate-nucleotide diphosphorylase [Tuwongella immobilis]|uniref:Probable nicotinate-nucleotide pyrophosphorylase [carboxylating] n=1 Tax=Tuwongella immobilis TaxID=692036 RepID=A0A6C2YUR2_9BACT|nr:carboxylating nicotinate-nucleotide diphosphorylase [Tuwongella immobilis]VIP04655.1 nicotinate-nucleotide pyrophosphorylase : Nicotinate-nucleotide pyrophosphorylase OS=Singulisphaera acidiphila (strain ATCC BAA-1392 / DSM 18658 / VKM B-2454 / MOB10) GN=Sinac_6785 PE=3 SV=1: QRPTase_N: QRPTase_C [Tuwongella immobilis]VTS06671.1 nicotinate-nucleotide pyrophosphorylase : Nicotinate-nucleotide pyrophosphorylase OS=Singulisphaera acidiphila (strain ATCC BAA-1392 / DSM 18658 / VKM B-2454 / MOB10) 